jgi:hypothetical protein
MESNTRGAPTVPDASVMRQIMIGIRTRFCLNAEIGKGVENSKSVQEPQNHGNNYDNIQDPFD